MTAQTHTTLVVLRRKQVESRTGLSRSAIYAKLQQNPKRPGDYDPSFPRQVSVGAKAVGWLAHEIDAWLVSQVEKSRAKQAKRHDIGGIRRSTAAN